MHANIDEIFIRKIIDIQNSLIGSDFNLQNFMQMTAEKMQTLTPATGVVIELVEGDDMVYRAAVGTVAPYVGLRLKRESSISGLCIASGEILVSQDTEIDERVNLEACRKVRARSLVVAPLIHRGKAIGVLKILSVDKNAFSHEDLQILMLVAGFIAAGLSHQLDYKKIEELLHQNALLMNAKNDFISMVSHELRTPLTSILGSLNLLTDNKDICPEYQSLIQIAKNNSERLVRLVNDILDVQKIESNQIQFQFESVAMLKLVQEAMEINQGFAKQFNIQLDLERKADAMVSADHDRLIQVLTNLISNAVKFSAGPAVKINIDKIDNKIRIEVCNEGPELPAEAKQKLFQKFTQLPSHQTTVIKGSGLGLNISKEIIEKHGGNIGFSSNPTVTKFYFELPIKKNLT